jgi:hypothetical protein
MSLLFVLEDSLQQIAGHSDVKRMAPASHEIRAIDPLVHGKKLIANHRRRQAPCTNRHYRAKIQWIASPKALQIDRTLQSLRIDRKLTTIAN